MLWVLLLTVAVGAEQDLVRNPGFEQVSGGLPEHWNLYVKEYPPLERPDVPARGSVDTAAREGGYAAFLHNPVPYLSEPCNNWSQIVWGDLAGKKLLLSGSIKTEDAASAALWLQCWQRTPYKLLSVSSTSDRSPVTGTADWRAVEMSVDVPAGTGFVMVRCVLRGKGKAWFDGLSLKEVAPPPAPPKSEAPPAAPKPPAAAPAAKPKTDLIELQAVLDSMKAASKANQDLLLQVESLQGEIQALREQLKSLQDAATQAPAATQPPPPSAAVSSEPAPAKRVPPLVPHEAGPEDVP